MVVSFAWSLVRLCPRGRAPPFNWVGKIARVAQTSRAALSDFAHPTTLSARQGNLVFFMPLPRDRQPIDQHVSLYHLSTYLYKKEALVAAVSSQRVHVSKIVSDVVTHSLLAEFQWSWSRLTRSFYPHLDLRTFLKGRNVKCISDLSPALA